MNSGRNMHDDVVRNNAGRHQKMRIYKHLLEITILKQYEQYLNCFELNMAVGNLWVFIIKFERKLRSFT